MSPNIILWSNDVTLASNDVRSGSGDVTQAARGGSAGCRVASGQVVVPLLGDGQLRRRRVVIFDPARTLHGGQRLHCNGTTRQKQRVTGDSGRSDVW